MGAAVVSEKTVVWFLVKVLRCPRGIALSVYVHMLLNRHLSHKYIVSAFYK
jgi:hypothetical protein